MKFSRLAAAAVLVAASTASQAALFTSSIGSLVPGYTENDDYILGTYNLGFTLNLFGTDYTTFSLSNNGLATFGGSTGSYSPTPLNTQSFGYPVVTPFWTDLDSRSDPIAGAGVYITQTATQTVVTWKDLGYYSENYSGDVTFQLVLNDPTAVPVGEGVIGFFYGNMSAGTDAHNATAGFGDGSSAINPGEVSYASGTSQDVSAALSGTSVWFDVNAGGVPSVIPEPGSIALMLAGLGLTAAALRRKRG